MNYSNDRDRYLEKFVYLNIKTSVLSLCSIGGLSLIAYSLLSTLVSTACLAQGIDERRNVDRSRDAQITLEQQVGQIDREQAANVQVELIANPGLDSGFQTANRPMMVGDQFGIAQGTGEIEESEIEAEGSEVEESEIEAEGSQVEGSEVEGSEIEGSEIEAEENVTEAAEATEPPIAPPGDGAVIADIEVRFVDRDEQPTTGETRSFIITREFDLQPGDAYDQPLAQEGLDRLNRLDIVRRADLTLEPAANSNQVTMVIQVVERPSFRASFDTTERFPSALTGPLQPRSVSAGPSLDTGFAVGGSVQLRNLGGNNQDLTLRLRGGERVAVGEISFRDPWIAGNPHRMGYALNVFSQRAVQSVFTGGDRDVDLPDEGDPWVHRLGGGFQFFRPLSNEVTAALGLSYQRVSVREDVFSSEVFPSDELGNSLTYSDSGQDDLLILTFAADYDRRTYRDPVNRDQAIRGSLVRFGLDQSIPIGDASISFTRLSASFLQYIPLRLFGFAAGPRTLILSLQGGTMIGEVPPYEAYNLNSVRGIGDALGAGRSFVQGTAEYRFPIANFAAFEEPVELGGAIFADYASDLGSGDTILGEPSIVRDKPESGFGYGVGLNLRTSIGTALLEFSWSDDDSEIVFSVGDRF